MNEGQAGFGLRCQAWLNRHNLAAPDTFKAITMTPSTMDLTQKQFIVAFLEAGGATSRKDVQEAFADSFGVSAKKSFNTVLERLKGAGQVIEQGSNLVAVGDE